MKLTGVFIACCSLLFFSCAHQVSPQGGPKDTEPPKILSTYPAPFTLHFQDNRIAIEFDEYVDHRSTEESIFISPHVGNLEFDWSGTEVEVTFNGKLRPNRTYVVNVGTDVRDLRNQNRMAHAFTLAFSTGDEIDHGAIQGRVFSRQQSDDAQGVMVFAYALDGVKADTLNPRTQTPDYITQTGNGGDFFFRHLSFGAYRVYAVRDQYHNLVYDPEADEFGVPFRSIVLTPTDTLASGLWIRLSREDTTRPRLIKVSPADRNHVTAEFSEELDTGSVALVGFSIVDTLSGGSLPVIAVFQNPAKPVVYTLVTGDQDSTKGYRLAVKRAMDLAGNSIHANASSLGFTGSGFRDTMGLRFASSSITDSSRRVVLSPVINLFFTDAVKLTTQNFIQLYDSSKSQIPVSIRWHNSASAEVSPLRELSGTMWYTVAMDFKKVEDWRGKSGLDSLKLIRFETLDADLLSGIEGLVIDNRSRPEESVVVQAEVVGGKNPDLYVTKTKAQSAFALSNMKEAQYIISAFADANGNSKYDAGQAYPYVPAERFVVYADTLKLRARWPVEGLRIDFK